MEIGVISTSDIWNILEGMYLWKDIFWEIISQMESWDLIDVISKVLEKYKGITNFSSMVIQYTNYKLYWEDVLKHQKFSQTKTIVAHQVESILI